MDRKNNKGRKYAFNFRNTDRAVIYLRVSSEEQARDAYGLESQRSRCERYCQERGWTVVQVFCDAGISGWADVVRFDFDKMMNFILKDHNVNLVFLDFSRFSRDTRRALNDFDKLDKLGIVSISVSNQSIDCRTAAGRTARRNELSQAEDFSDTHSEKQKERMKVAITERGTITGRANLGYKNVAYRKKDEPNVEPNEPAFSLVRQSFEKMETGTYSPAEGLREMTKLGLRTVTGKVMEASAFKYMLSNPIYIGKVPSREYGTQSGKHQRCVSDETFDRVQLVLKGKKPTTSPYQRNRKELPLRRFLKCGVCGSSLTGAGVANKYKTTYYYYWCFGCKGTKVRSDTAHREFESELDSLRFDAPLNESFLGSLRAAWEARNGESASVLTKLRRDLVDVQAKYKKLLDKYVNDDPHIRDIFPEMKADLDAEIESLQEQIAESEMARATFDELKEFTQKLPSNLAQLWREAPINLKQKVQNTLFLGGLKYDTEKGILNSNNQNTFNQLREFFAGNGYMVGPEGFEPPTKGL